MGLLFARDYYQLNHLPGLVVENVHMSSVPEPYLRLLSHSHYMTHTLSCYANNPVQLNRLSQHSMGQKLQRVVSLETRQQVPLMVAFIEIFLTALSEELAEAVILGREPLGRLLLENNILPNIECQYLHKVRSDDFLSQKLQRQNSSEVQLYGRSSIVKNQHHQVVANSFEVLSPVVQERF